MSASYLALHLKIDFEDRLRSKLYDKRDTFNFLLWTLHLYVATFQQRLHIEYMYIA